MDPPSDRNMPRTRSGSSIQMVEDPLAGLQRPVPHARNQPASSASATAAAGGNGGGGTSGSNAAIATINAAPPMIDATKLNPTRVPSLTKRDRSHQSITRIENMDQLEKPIMMLEGGESGSLAGAEPMTEAEKRMQEEELSFYSASDNDHGDDNIWGLLSGVGGNIYEW